MGVEHHALHVDLAVADPDAVRYGRPQRMRPSRSRSRVARAGRGSAPAAPPPARARRRRASRRRRTATPGSRQRRAASAPSSGWAADQLAEGTPALERSRATERRRPWRGRRGTACRRATSSSARSVAAASGVSAAACIALDVEARRRQQAGSAASASADLVDRVEQRLLVLLQVAVVGEREALQRGEQPGEVADEAARLAPGQLGDVGVLLLRQHRGAGGVGVVEAERSRTRRSTTARSPRRCGDRCTPSSASANSASATKSRSRHGVEAVLEAGGEAEVGGHAVGSSGSDEPASAPAPSGETSSRRRASRSRSTSRPGPTRGPAGGGPAAPAGPAAGGCSRAGRRRRPRRPGRAAPAGARARRRHRRERPLRVQAEVGGDLVVAAAPGVQLGARPAPASSVTRRSTAVWMSSSVGTNANVPSASSPRPGRGRPAPSPASSSVEDPGPRRGPARGPASRRCRRPPSRWSKGRLTVKAQQLVGRTALEPAVPEGHGQRHSAARPCPGGRPRSGRRGPTAGRSRRSPRAGSLSAARRSRGRSRRGCPGSGGRRPARPGSRCSRTSPVTKRWLSSTKASSACFSGENHRPS